MNLMLLLCLLLPAGADGDSPFEESLQAAEQSLASGAVDTARHYIDRALERDPRSIAAWDLRVRWAETVGDRDELVYSLHKLYRFALDQKAPRRERDRIRMRIEENDPIAPDLFNMKTLFVKRLVALADFYEKERRPHSAIRIHKEILALEPERMASEEAIERLASAPDPSLADSARRRDLFADVSDEWIREFNADHDTWKTRAEKEREHYITKTDAGYEVLVLAAEAMEQINAFYRVFFQYGTPEDGRNVSRIDLRIFKNREEYLKFGSSPAEWSGGQFTGSAVETYVGDGGVASMVTVLFHEAAHQFVALATSAVGWLNEGLASFFEGTRILANGSVQMNYPANHRLFPLAERMERGWMTGPDDGLDPSDPAAKTPPKSPTFRIIIENRYAWGPAWYAPTWGVVYFLYNYQDPIDGRFIYRNALRVFIDKSGGRAGEGAVRNFEEVVLANPAKATPGVAMPKKGTGVALPKTIAELDAVWKDWTIALRNEEMGRIKVARPFHRWAKNAITRGDIDDAAELFEKGLVEDPEDVPLLLDFASFLAGRQNNSDRAGKLALRAVRILELAQDVDEKALRKAGKLLARWDPRWKTLSRINEEMSATVRTLARRYLDEDLTLMTMDLSWRLGTELGLTEIFDYFEKAMRRSGKSPWIWELAYNERNLDGWVASANEIFVPNGPILEATFGTKKEDQFEYRFLAVDRVTSGDFSFEAEIQADGAKNNYCGLVFGKKSGQSFHGLVLFPSGGGTPLTGASAVARSGYVDLTSFYGDTNFNVWRHNSVQTHRSAWHKMRLDVTGRIVDVWFDGELVVSQEFSSLGVLKGSFGLIMGNGTARFRNIRYLARAPGDPGARIAREIRMEKIRASQPASARGSVNGSWLGQVPPWPDAVRWVQGERRGWEDRGAAPTVLLFWSRQQNDIIPVNNWLAFLKEKYAGTGLEFLCIAAHDDDLGIAGYLKQHPLPGVVAVDRIRRKGYGEVFETYSIQKFNMPRLLLLDIDHTVIWEGDPGFKAGKPWKRGIESYLEAPIDAIVERHDLRTLYKWRSEWTGSARKALRRGDLAAALPVLRAALELDVDGIAEVEDARGSLDSLETAVASLEAVALTLSRSRREAALGALVKWGRILGKPIDSRTKLAIKKPLSGGTSRDWARALALAGKCRKGMKPGKEAAAVEALLAGLEKLDGPFVRELEKTIADVAGAGDAALVRPLLDAADRLPAEWLAREYFRF
jgi:tetratricopeptide (TPR) repeat protein